MFFQKFLRFIGSEFNTRDRVLLTIILCSIPFILIELIMHWITGPAELGELVTIWFEGLAGLAGLTLLLYNGTVMQTKYWRYMIISMVLIMFSFALIILHLPGAFELLVAGCIMLEIIYTLKFVRQNYTPLSGWFKYGWVCSWIVVSLGIILHFLPEPWTLLPDTMFWIALALFLREKWVVAVKYRGLV